MDESFDRNVSEYMKRIAEYVGFCSPFYFTGKEGAA